MAQNEYLAGFPGVNFYEVGIYTSVNQYDTNLNAPQEFLPIVPEPGTWILLASGLVGWMGRKRLI